MKVYQSIMRFALLEENALLKVLVKNNILWRSNEKTLQDYFTQPYEGNTTFDCNHDNYCPISTFLSNETVECEIQTFSNPILEKLNLLK